MQESKTWIIAVVALIIGAVGGYYSIHSRVGAATEQVSTLETQLTEANEKAKGTEAQATDLAEQVSVLEAQLSEANEKAKSKDVQATDLAEQVSALQSEIDEKSKLVAAQAARIKQLEAASQ